MWGFLVRIDQLYLMELANNWVLGQAQNEKHKKYVNQVKNTFLNGIVIIYNRSVGEKIFK